MHNICHFGVRADDVERAKTFYETVFGWSFEAWGPPNFYTIKTSSDPSAIIGALWQRETPYEGGGFCGFECTISVEDVDHYTDKIKAAGGTIVFEKSVIKGVGELIRFQDTESNFLCAMRYDSTL